MLKWTLVATLNTFSKDYKKKVYINCLRVNIGRYCFHLGYYCYCCYYYYLRNGAIELGTIIFKKLWW